MAAIVAMVAKMGQPSVEGTRRVPPDFFSNPIPPRGVCRLHSRSAKSLSFSYHLVFRIEGCAVNQLNVHFLPSLVAPEALAGGTAVVIDVLRATTTIVYALAAGARAVIPRLTIEDAKAAAARLPRGTAILAGERGGLPIEGFDLGNSPAEFTPASVGGRYVVLTTTNGTKALLHCRQADRVLIGSFANLSALCYVLGKLARVHLVCAGTDDQLTSEDAILAGAIVEQLLARGNSALDIDAKVAQTLWDSIAKSAPDERIGRVIDVMRLSPGGRNLLKIGMESDIAIAARVDCFNIVPRFDPATGEVTA
jgi:2-phosphosulfolactate phosphatase